MKLRNKKTGQEGNFIINKDHFECVDLEYVPEYETLAELSEEWEDYEEPAEAYYIDFQGGIRCASRDNNWSLEKKIGNYFETKEEAEKAVEKLMAWKRLKDNGLTFKNWTRNQTGTIDCFANWNENIPPSVHSQQLSDDLNLLFGGGE